MKSGAVTFSRNGQNNVPTIDPMKRLTVDNIPNIPPGLVRCPESLTPAARGEAGGKGRGRAY
jgi:hypothetical protein